MEVFPNGANCVLTELETAARQDPAAVTTTTAAGTTTTATTTTTTAAATTTTAAATTTTVAATTTTTTTAAGGGGSISIANHSFESPVVADFGGSPDNWSIDGSGQVSPFKQSGATFSSRIAALPDGTDQGVFSRGGDLYQVLGTSVAAKKTYTLTVDVGDRTDTGFPGAELRLGIGATFGANLLTARVVANATPANGGWATWVSTFATGASPTPGALRVEVLNTGGDQPLFDNVRLTGVDITGTIFLLR